jgi:hypothetical protein
LFWAIFFFANFLGALSFFAGCRGAVRFLTAVLFDFFSFSLVFFLVAIRAV